MILSLQTCLTSSSGGLIAALPAGQLMLNGLPLLCDTHNLCFNP